MTEQQKRITKVIAEQLGINENFVLPSSNIIADFGADSLDAIELVMALEDEFGIELVDDECEKCATVQDVFNLIAREVAP
ncbi:MAG: acyl carrier protein [Pseudomonadota bacterium]